MILYVPYAMMDTTITSEIFVLIVTLIIAWSVPVLQLAPCALKSTLVTLATIPLRSAKVILPY